MCGKKFLCQWLWHSLAKLCTKNYENPSIFVKVTAKKSVAPFFLDTVYMFGMTLTRPSLAIQLTSIAWTSSHICSGKRRTLRATIVTTFSHMIRAFQFLSNVTRFLHCFFWKLPRIRTSSFRKVVRQHTEGMLWSIIQIWFLLEI